MATYWVSQRLHLDLPILSYINTQMDFLANTIFYRWEKWAPLKKISDLLKVTQLTATEQWHVSYFKTCCPFQKQTCSGNLAENEKEQTTISGSEWWAGVWFLDQDTPAPPGLLNLLLTKPQACPLRPGTHQNDLKTLWDSQVIPGKFYFLHSTSLAEVYIKIFKAFQWQGFRPKQSMLGKA